MSIWVGKEPEVSSDTLRVRSNCIALKMETGKPFGILKIRGEMSIVTVAGQEVMRNLSETNDQIIVHIDVYANYFCSISPRTPLKAIRALRTKKGGKTMRIDGRKTEAYVRNQVILNIAGLNMYTKTMITCDDNLAG